MPQLHSAHPSDYSSFIKLMMRGEARAARHLAPAGHMRKQRMKWAQWDFARGRGDFLPILVGCVLLLISVPTLILLIVYPDPGSGAITRLAIYLFSAGTLLGLSFLVLGIRLCSFPGSLAYRITHGRLFW
jgi:hypothetical protein